MAEFQLGPEGGGPLVAARWQHGATPGVKVLGAWVSVGYSDHGPEARRTYLVFEASAREQVEEFTRYLRPYCPQVEIRPVSDYLPFIEAYESGDPGRYPEVPPGTTAEARQRQLEVFRRYVAAPTTEAAVQIWWEVAGRNLPGD